jgi:phosphoribosylaminoimidazole-succinocarboxamide synthase
MSENNVLISTDLPLKVFIRGKARDTYSLSRKLLIVTTDRISAFDRVLPNGIPNKGKVLNQISAFWFEKTKKIVPNHMIEPLMDVTHLDSYIPAKSRFVYPGFLAGRSMIVKRAKRFPIECVVRGYLSGSAWEEYVKMGTVAGTKIPTGMRESEKLPEPLFTPTTKADTGHDLPMTIEEIRNMLGDTMANAVKAKSLEMYDYARKFALERGIIIADTKFEFGLYNEKLIIIDEVLTPDSSRFWDVVLYKVGQAQPSYDKQPLRDWLVSIGWNKEPPAPNLPADVVARTQTQYETAFERLTGQKLK